MSVKLDLCYAIFMVMKVILRQIWLRYNSTVLPSLSLMKFMMSVDDWDIIDVYIGNGLWSILFQTIIWFSIHLSTVKSIEYIDEIRQDCNISSVLGFILYSFALGHCYAMAISLVFSIMKVHLKLLSAFVN